MPALPVIEELCRAGGNACVRCCHGARVDRAALVARLERQTALFARSVGDRPTVGRLRAYELWARGWSGVGWGLLLSVPLVGDLLRPWLKERTACAFLGMVDGAPGCLLHPSRWGGEDQRGRAFAWWRGFGCGAPEWRCLPAWRFARASQEARRGFVERTAGMDWDDYGRATSRFHPDRAP